MTNDSSGQKNGRFSLISPLLITLFSLPALQPLASRQLTCGFDNAFHLWRSVQIGALIREGIWFSRWAPHMAHGYGYPLYLYQSPLSAYLAAFLNIVGVDWPLAINAIYGFGLLGSGLTTWWLARDFFGERGGVLAAVAMLFAPFHLYVVFYRGSLSETVAWIFPPLVLWGVYRWQVLSQRRGMITAVFATILLFYSHDVTGYIFLPLFLLWPFGLAFVFNTGTQINADEHRFGDVWRGFTAVLLGFFSSAFFWLPAILERDLIQFGRAGNAWPFLPQNNYLPLDQLFALPRNADPLLLNDWPERGLGVVLLLFALVGIGIGLRKAGVRRRLTAVFTTIFLGYLFLVTPLSSFLWDHTILSAFQFPWRFLSPVVLMACLLIGNIFNSNPKTPTLPITQLPNYPITQLPNYPYLTLLILLPLLHFGWLTPNHCAAPADTTIEGMVAWERDTGTLGTTASRELLPTTVQRLPQDEDGALPWLNRFGTLPEGVQLISSEPTAIGGRFVFASDEAFTAVYQAFAFPGWNVRINGTRTNITALGPDGFMAFGMPAGETEVVIWRGNTAVQLLGIFVSIMALFGVSWLVFKRAKRNSHQSSTHPITQLPNLPISQSPNLPISLILLPLILVTLSQTSLFKRSALLDNQLTAVHTPSSLTFGTPDNPAQVKLLGLDAFPTSVPSDEALALALYWQAMTPLTENYRVGLTLMDEKGVRWSEVGLRDYRWSRSAPPSTSWTPDSYVKTHFFVDWLTGTPPGVYDLELTFFEENSLAPLTIYADGAPLGPSVSLATLTISDPKRPFTPTTIGLDTPAPLAQNGRIDQTIWRVLFDRQSAIPGDVVLVTIFWEGEPSSVELRLVDAGGTAVFSNTPQLNIEEEGLWRHQQLVRLPASLADGAHQWQLRLPDGAIYALDALMIDAPERLFDQPETAVSLLETFGDVINLVGVVEPIGALPAGESFDVSLVWQGVAEMDESYRVFVQVLDENGRIVTQSDGLPANWTRPTTGWQVGEFVVDSHTLTVPQTAVSGTYRLVLGLYTVENGRLLTTQGQDFVEIKLDIE